MLLKVWLRQRGMEQRHGHPDGFVLAMAMVGLLERRILARSMSSYQLLRVTLQYLGAAPNPHAARVHADVCACPPRLTGSRRTCGARDARVAGTLEADKDMIVFNGKPDEVRPGAAMSHVGFRARGAPGLTSACCLHTPRRDHGAARICCGRFGTATTLCCWM